MLTAVIDPSSIVAVAASVGFLLILLTLPAIARSPGLPILAALAALVFYRREALGFAIVSSIGYLAVTLIAKETVAARRWKHACTAIFGAGVIFTCGRIWHWDRMWSVPMVGQLAFFSLGMWQLLRLVTLLWEVGSGAVATPSIRDYLVWMCLPFTLAGPLLRWSQMPSAWQVSSKELRSATWWSSLAQALGKFLLGVGLPSGQTWLAAHWHSHIGNNAIATFLTSPMGFYLNMAGLFECMELLARPCGVKIPPSFNYPIGRQNISNFWMNWNMTATYVFRDYLFYNRWGRQTYNIYFNTILLFTLVGLWHAANAYWVLWGFLHGLLFTGYLLWRKWSPRLQHLPLRGTRLAGLSAAVFTYFCVCICWYLPSKFLQKLALI